MPKATVRKKTVKKGAKKSEVNPVRELARGITPRVRASAASRGAFSNGVKKPEEIAAPPVADIVLSDPSPADSAEAALGESAKRPDRYFEAVGRRKTAIARARLFTKAGDFLVNTKIHTGYFPTGELQRIVEDPLKKMKLWERFRVSIKVSGGGSHAQAEAVRHALARCLVKFNPDFRKRLKRAGFLRRDPRAKERKKFGLKKARRAPQWNKR